MYLYHVHGVACGGQKSVLDPVELELWAVVGHHVASLVFFLQVLFSLESSAFYMGTGNLNLGLHACESSFLPTEPFVWVLSVLTRDSLVFLLAGPSLIGMCSDGDEWTFRSREKWNLVQTNTYHIVLVMQASC